MAELFIDKKLSYAVLGATTNTSKFGFKVLNHLNEQGFKVVGINPNYTSINDIPCYSSLSSIPDDVDVLVIVTPPTVTNKVLETLPVQTKVWMQPGSFNEDSVRMCEDRNILYIAGACMLQSA